MPETTKIHVYKEADKLIKDYALKYEKEHGVKITGIQAAMMLLQAGYKSLTGKDYKPKRKE